MGSSAEKNFFIPREETIELIKRAQKGDMEAKDILYHRTLGLIRSVLKGFANRGYEIGGLYFK